MEPEDTTQSQTPADPVVPPTGSAEDGSRLSGWTKGAIGLFLVGFGLLGLIVTNIVDARDGVLYLLSFRFSRAVADASKIASMFAIMIVSVGMWAQYKGVNTFHSSTKEGKSILAVLALVILFGISSFVWYQGIDPRTQYMVSILVHESAGVTIEEAKEIADARLGPLRTRSPIDDTYFEYHVEAFNTNNLIDQIESFVKDDARLFVILSGQDLHADSRLVRRMQGMKDRVFIVCSPHFNTASDLSLRRVESDVDNIFWIMPSTQSKLKAIIDDATRRGYSSLDVIQLGDRFSTMAMNELRTLSRSVPELEINELASLDEHVVGAAILIVASGEFVASVPQLISRSPRFVREMYVLTDDFAGVHAAQIRGSSRRSILVPRPVLPEGFGLAGHESTWNYMYSIEMIRYGWTAVASQNVSSYDNRLFVVAFTKLFPRVVFENGMNANVHSDMNVIPWYRIQNR